MPSGLALSPVDATMLGLWPRFEAEGVLLREAPALRGDDGVLARLLRSSLKERSKSSVEGLRPHDFHRDARPTQPPVEAEVAVSPALVARRGGRLAMAGGHRCG